MNKEDFGYYRSDPDLNWEWGDYCSEYDAATGMFRLIDTLDGNYFKNGFFTGEASEATLVWFEEIDGYEYDGETLSYPVYYAYYDDKGNVRRFELYSGILFRCEGDEESGGTTIINKNGWMGYIGAFPIMDWGSSFAPLKIDDDNWLILINQNVSANRHCAYRYGNRFCVTEGDNNALFLWSRGKLTCLALNVNQNNIALLKDKKYFDAAKEIYGYRVANGGDTTNIHIPSED